MYLSSCPFNWLATVVPSITKSSGRMTCAIRLNTVIFESPLVF